MYTNNAQSIQMLNDFGSLSQLLKATTRVCVCATYFDLDSEAFVCLQQVKLWLDGLSESRVHREQCTYLGAGRDKSTKMIFVQIQIQKYKKQIQIQKCKNDISSNTNVCRPDN